MDIRTACVVGAGRVGTAIAARLGEHLPTRLTGRDLTIGEPDLILVCVPDRAIAEVAAGIHPGPWVAHTSGACTLDALEPHIRRFSLHPLQTFTLDRGPEQLDGAWAAVTAESPEAESVACWLAGRLGVEPFPLDDAARPLYHAGATVAAGFLATLHEVAADLMRLAGAPPEALEPLMRRTMENGFAATGPHVRGDWKTVERHLEAIRDARPDYEPVYRALSEATSETVSR